MRLILHKVDDDSGEVEFSASCSQGELNYLINFAVESLMQLGSIAVDASRIGEEQNVELPAEIVEEEPEAPTGPITIN